VCRYVVNTTPLQPCRRSASGAAEARAQPQVLPTRTPVHPSLTTSGSHRPPAPPPATPCTLTICCLRWCRTRSCPPRNISSGGRVPPHLLCGRHTPPLPPGWRSNATEAAMPPPPPPPPAPPPPPSPPPLPPLPTVAAATARSSLCGLLPPHHLYPTRPSCSLWVPSLPPPPRRPRRHTRRHPPPGCPLPRRRLRRL